MGVVTAVVGVTVAVIFRLILMWHNGIIAFCFLPLSIICQLPVVMVVVVILM